MASKSGLVSGLKVRPLNQEQRMNPDSVNGPSKIKNEDNRASEIVKGQRERGREPSF